MGCAEFVAFELELEGPIASAVPTAIVAGDGERDPVTVLTQSAERRAALQGRYIVGLHRGNDCGAARLLRSGKQAEGHTSTHSQDHEPDAPV